MKYWKIIFFSFLTGCVAVVASLIIVHARQPYRVRHHYANDMIGVAYGLAIGFNIVLALSSLPVLLWKSNKAQKLWRAVALLFALPLVFTLYATCALDFYALLYCLPYLLSLAVLSALSISGQKKIHHSNKPTPSLLKNESRAAKLTIGAYEVVKEDYLRLPVLSGNRPCGSIDFISQKINFNIAGPYYFKGMEALEHVTLEYIGGRLIFTFGNKKSMSFDCNRTEFEKVSEHIKTYGYRKIQ